MRKIDDTKRCICNPPLSGRKPECLRCHPKKVKKEIADPKKPEQVKHYTSSEKPGQIKKHNAIPTGQLPWVKQPEEIISLDPLYADAEEEN